MKGIISSNIDESAKLHHNILKNKRLVESVVFAVRKITAAIESKSKILVAGNGGSAADAQHFVAELVGRFQIERNGFPAIALTTNTSLVTALANDYSFDRVFARQVETLARPGDIFVAITTSGNSNNIISALESANKIGIESIGLLGKDGGKAKNLCTIPIIVPHNSTARIQEIHILMIHSICDAVEKYFAQKSK
ncbi:phosphoheptose isomerase [bacterium]|nr:MAG: phosphoheptose isomerase [bacterium]